jgi:hypothetical protein
MININYFSNSRLSFFSLMFHFIKKIKPKNKEKITLNILTTKENVLFFEGFKNDGININIIEFNDGFNYTEKLKFVLNLKSDYSVKLDEDCIINNHIWDYMIEMSNVLDDENNLLISPLLSTTLPSCDEFINGFLSSENKEIVNGFLLKQKMPNGLFGVNYEPLNKYTVDASEWDYKAYLDGLDSLPTNMKGMHPMRISYDAQTTINDLILKNHNKIIDNGEYSLFEIKSPYFTNNLFLIKTSVWKHIFEVYGGVYDEIPISDYKKNNNKKFLFIKNGFGIHTMYNTIYGNSNKWGIGGVDSEQKELEFVEDLKKIIL